LGNHIERLAIDHQHAKQLAAILQQKDFIGEILPVQTNIVIFEVKGRLSATEFVHKLQEQNMLMFAISPTQVRMVLHLDITEQMVQQTIDAINQL